MQRVKADAHAYPVVREPRGVVHRRSPVFPVLGCSCGSEGRGGDAVSWILTLLIYLIGFVSGYIGRACEDARIRKMDERRGPEVTP